MCNFLADQPCIHNTLYMCMEAVCRLIYSGVFFSLWLIFGIQTVTLGTMLSGCYTVEPVYNTVTLGTMLSGCCTVEPVYNTVTLGTMLSGCCTVEPVYNTVTLGTMLSGCCTVEPVYNTVTLGTMLQWLLYRRFGDLAAKSDGY